MPEFTHSGTPVQSDIKIGIWEMRESEKQLLAVNQDLLCFSAQLNAMKSATRRLEYLSVRHLLSKMLGYIPEIKHNADGKPFLPEPINISITHTKGYAAVALSQSMTVAIDMEYRSDRVRRIASRFLRPDEMPLSTEAMLLCWCAKETLYKLHSADKLSFSDMRVSALPEHDGLSSGKVIAENLRRNVAVDVHFIATTEFVLTYAFEKDEKM